MHTARAVGAVRRGPARARRRTTRPASPQLLQSHGAELSVSTDPDRLLFATTLLPDGLAPVLGVLAELLTAATYPDDRVEGERDRVAERIAIARSQPGVIARTALAARRYGDHPYAIAAARPPSWSPPSTAPRCASLHRERVLPAGSTLVLVGDLDPGAAADAVAAALGGWSARGHAVEAPPVRRAARRRRRAGRPARARCSPTSGSAGRRRGAPIPTSPPSGWPT